MTLAGLLRGAAIAIAVGGILDPALTVTREIPLGVVVRAGSADRESHAVAGRVHERLASALRDRIDLDPPADPGAVVVTGIIADTGDITDGVPVSIVLESMEARPNLRVVGISGPDVSPAGTIATIHALVAAEGAAGRTSAIVLQHDGVVVDRLEHAWTANEEVFHARFDHVPSGSGVRALRVHAVPLDEETSTSDNHADLRLTGQDQRLRILVYEPRPSWMAAFIRRALERDPLFDVASLVRPSRGVAVRAGEIPDRLRLETLEPFDAVVVGAPEELSRSDVETLGQFARQRGGAMVLAPDRRPSGPYAALIPAGSFEERLLDAPVEANAAAGSLRASELAVPVDPSPAVDALAAFDAAEGATVPVVLQWPAGLGHGIFSGALDAWRYRRDEEFAAFWRAHVAAAALASPPPVEVRVEPGMAPPGEEIALTVRVRPTEFDREGSAVALPAVSAWLAPAEDQEGGRPGGEGSQHAAGGMIPIRLWPDAEPGAFRARFVAPPPGTYIVTATAAGTPADTVLIVAGDARAPRPDIEAGARLLARASGGVVVSSDDLSPLVEHLASLPRDAAGTRMHPARSAWWMAAFVALVCAEWTTRRKRGLR